MKIKNVSTAIAVIDDRLVGGLSLTLYPQQEVTVFDIDAGKSPTLKEYMDDGYIIKTGESEPSPIGDLFIADDTTKVLTFSNNLKISPALRPVEDYAYLLKVDDGAGLLKGLLNQKTYAFGILATRPLGSNATGDSNDALIKGSYNNYAANDNNYIARGINVGINNRSGGNIGQMDNNLGCQNKSGATVRIITGLTIVPENYGTVVAEFGGLAIDLKNEGSVATKEYGIRIANKNNSLGTKVGSAILVENSGVNTGFTTGLNLNGASLTNEIVFTSGIKVTVTVNSITFTNASDNKTATIDLISGGGSLVDESVTTAQQLVLNNHEARIAALEALT